MRIYREGEAGAEPAQRGFALPTNLAGMFSTAAHRRQDRQKCLCAPAPLRESFAVWSTASTRLCAEFLVSSFAASNLVRFVRT